METGLKHMRNKFNLHLHAGEEGVCTTFGGGRGGGGGGGERGERGGEVGRGRLGTGEL